MMGWRHLTDSLLAAQQLECTSMNLTAALVSLGVHALCPSRLQQLRRQVQVMITTM